MIACRLCRSPGCADAIAFSRNTRIANRAFRRSAGDHLSSAGGEGLGAVIGLVSPVGTAEAGGTAVKTGAPSGRATSGGACSDRPLKPSSPVTAGSGGAAGKLVLYQEARPAERLARVMAALGAEPHSLD
jgi:hypothetical protein